MSEKLNHLSSKKASLILFTGFAILNLYYFINNFITTFFNASSNADEYYENNLYSLSSVTIDKLFYTPSQPYIFLSSLLNVIIDSPKIAVRSMSLLSCIILLFYFIKRIKIKAEEDSLLENTYRISFFVCAIFITNQMFVGTSDFLSNVFLVFAFYFVLKSISSNEMRLSNKKSIIVGLFFGIAFATRPTAIVLIVSFYFSILLVLGFKNIFLKQNYIIGLAGILVFILINIIPIIEQKTVILDVKEVPKETGVTWFQRNYLMTKLWDEGKIPNTKWISTIEVINYKKENPDFVFPKNQLELLIKEPGLYFRQILRMFFKGLYSSYRFMYLLFPLLFLSFFRNNIFFNFLQTNTNEIVNDASRTKIVVLTHLISIILFSFLAVKLLEFRWLIPSLIVYTFFSINYLSNFTRKSRFLIYNLSFLSGITMYLWFFIIDGF
nr:hypothetical protein [uncultured Flavobacterium sp.]